MTCTESIAESATDSFNRQLMAVVLFLALFLPATFRRRVPERHPEVREPVMFEARHQF